MVADTIAQHRAGGLALAEQNSLHADGSAWRVMCAAMTLIAAHDAQYIEGPRTWKNMPRSVEYTCKLLWLVRSEN